MLNNRSLLLVIILISAPLLLANVPYLNLLFLGIVKKLIYGLVVVLFIVQPKIENVIYFLILLMLAQYFLLVFRINSILDAYGLIFYTALIYIFIKLKMSWK